MNRDSHTFCQSFRLRFRSNPCAFLTVVTCTLLVAGCGQKGALFLPGDRSEVRTELPEGFGGGDEATDRESESTEGATRPADAPPRDEGRDGAHDGHADRQ